MMRLLVCVLFCLLGPLSAFAASFVTLEPGLAAKRGVMKPKSIGSEARAMRFDREALFALQPGAEIELGIPGVKPYRVTLDRTEQHTPEIASWVGRVSGMGTEFRVIATTGPGGTYGRIVTPEGDFAIVPGTGADFLVDMNAERSFLPVRGAEPDYLIHPAERAAALLQPRAKLGEECPRIASMPANTVTVDLLFVYTDTFTALHGAANVQTRINFLVNRTNQAYLDSNVAMRLRLVNTVQVTYPATKSVTDGLNEITDGVPPFENIAALREQFGADMVTLNQVPANSNSLGVAWLNGVGTGSIANSGARMFSSNMDSLTEDGLTLAHELGHNMGAAHDRANGAGGGVFPFSYGHIICGTGAAAGCGVNEGVPDVGNGFASIMAYGSPNVGKFSSPNLTCQTTRNGAVAGPCGVDAADTARQADNVRALNCVREQLAAIRATKVQAVCNNPAADTDNDGIPDCVEATEGRNAAAKDNDVFGNARLFVMQQYRDFLGREGDAAGIAFQTTQVSSGAQSRAQVTEAFFNSAEFQAAVAPITRLYLGTYRRIPDTAGLQFWVGEYRKDTSQANLQRISTTFATAQEFISAYGNLDNTAFVNKMYELILGRAGDAGGVSFWVGQLAAGTTRGVMLSNFTESAEYQTKTANDVYVIAVYVGMLRRAPDQAGFDFWKSRLASGGARLDLINGFLGAAEYRSRFLP